MESLRQKLFAILLGLNMHVFAGSDFPTVTTGEALVVESRLSVSPLMFTISIIILTFQLLVASLYYASRPSRFLPRIPTTIGSIIAFVAENQALENLTANNGEDFDTTGQR